MDLVILLIISIISTIIVLSFIGCCKYTVDALESEAESQYIMENSVRGEESVTSMRNMLARDPALMDFETSIF